MKLSSIYSLVSWIFIFIATLFYIRISWIQYANLRNGVDLGTYTQIAYNLASFHSFPPFNSILGRYAWGDHAHFIMILVAPIFSIYPHEITLILLQIIAITTSGWALWSIAQKRFENPIFSFAILISYLLFFGIQYALSFDVHANVFTAAALAWLFWAHYNKKNIVYWILLFIALITREDASLFCAALGLYSIIFQQRKEKIRGAITFAVSMLYFFVVNYKIMPLIEPHRTALAYFDIGTSSKNPLDIITAIFGHPITILQNMFDSSVKIRTMKNLFGSFGLLPLASPFSYLAAAPNFLARFLSGEQQRWDMKLHYSASVASILAYGAILGVSTISILTRYVAGSRLPRLNKNASTIISTIAALALLYGTYSVSLHDIDLPVHQAFAASNTNTVNSYALSTRKRLEDLQKNIPQQDSVTTISSFIPIFATRERVYNLKSTDKFSSDWIVISNQFTAWPLSREDINTTIHNLRENSAYQQISDSDGLFVFRKR